MNHDVPHMLGPADMNGAACGGDVAIAHGADMVAGNHRPHGVHLVDINAHQGGEAADCFGQNACCAAMQNAVDLVRAVVDGDSGLYKVWTDFGKF